MKKLLVTALAVLFLFPSIAHAQNRGVLRGLFASWYSISTDQTTITPPYDSRDILIQNNSDHDVYVDLFGGTINELFVDEVTATQPSITAIGAGQELALYDFITASVSLRSSIQTVSPISVVITY